MWQTLLQHDFTCVASRSRHVGEAPAIWESRFLLLLVPHPFSSSLWEDLYTVSSWHCLLSRYQGLRREQPLHMFSIWCFVLFIYFSWEEETLERYHLGLPVGGRDKRSTLEGREEKSKTVQSAAISVICHVQLDTQFWRPSCSAFMSKKDVEFHWSSI